MDLSQSDGRPVGSKWEESQSKCPVHWCSIDYQWKMSDSLSQVSLLQPTTPLRQPHKHTTKLYAGLGSNRFPTTSNRRKTLHV